MRPAALEKILAPIKKRIYLLIGRAIITAIDNTGKTQRIQGTFLKNELISGVERLQEYGLETYPDPTTAEGLVLFIDGNRDLGLCIVAHDRMNRPTDLLPGEVQLYDKGGNSVHLKLTSGMKLTGVGGETIIFDGIGNIEIGGKTDFAVSHTDLQAALSTFASSVNAALATKSDGAGAAGTLTLDISAAKVSTVKLP